MKYEIKVIVKGKSKSHKYYLKGSTFEDFIRLLMASQGYEILGNINFTGMELDLIAKHFDRPQEVVYVECKAKEKLASSEVGNFTFKVFHKQDATHGYFISTKEYEHQVGGLIETLAMFLPALFYLLWIWDQQTIEFGETITVSGLMMLAGPATAIPLILFANGAKRLRLTTLGLMQYMVPTMFFLQAVLIFGEPLEMVNLAAFGLIWLALAIYTYSLLHREKNNHLR